MKESFPRPDERTPRPSWPAKKGQPDDNPVTMPPSPLYPRHNPERPGDAPAQPPSLPDSRHAPERPDTASPQRPTKEELHKCLRDWLPNVEVYVKRRFPEYVVLEALEKAKSEGLSAIYGELHDKMKPEEMTSAGRRAWLLTVARNAALTVLRRKRTVPLRDDDMLPSAPTSSLDPHERQLVVEAVQKLPLASRQVIEAAYFEGLKGRAAAERLGMPPTTFRYRLAKAKRQFRNIFEQLSREF